MSLVGAGLVTGAMVMDLAATLPTLRRLPQAVVVPVLRELTTRTERYIPATAFTASLAGLASLLPGSPDAETVWLTVVGVAAMLAAAGTTVLVYIRLHKALEPGAVDAEYPGLLEWIWRLHLLRTPLYVLWLVCFAAAAISA